MKKLTILTSLALAIVVAGCRTPARPVTRVVPASFDSPEPEPTEPKPAHRVGLLDVGSEALVARIHLIRSAKKSIKLQTFIWTNDDVGRWMSFELIQAHKRGVEVRLIADPIESLKEPGAVAYAIHAGLRVKAYNPSAKRVAPSLVQKIERASRDFKGLNQRMHNKVMVVDSNWALVGGRNIENTYYGYAAGMNFRDREAIVVGPVVDDIEASFDAFWRHPLAVDGRELLDVAALLKSGKFPQPTTLEELGAAEVHAAFAPLLSDRALARRLLIDSLRPVRRVAFVADEPGKNRDESLVGSGRTTEAFVYLLRKAEKSVLVQTPYLVLSKRGAAEFKRLKRKKVAVVLSTNSLAATDNWPSFGMYHKAQRTLLEDLNARVYELKPVPGDLATLWPTYETTRARMNRIRKIDARAAKAQMPPPFGVTPDLRTVPYFCLHSKSMVIDDELSAVGSYNLDPRSANLNTESVLLIADRAFAKELAHSIYRDVLPRNSWVVWRRRRGPAGRLLGGVLADMGRAIANIGGIDMWPKDYASCFDLKPGATPVPPGHKSFYDNYKAVGSFPWVPTGSEKRIYARLIQTVGEFVAPLL